MSFSEWDNQRVQLEIYLKEHYVLLSRGRVWSALVTFGVAFAIALIGIYTLQAVRHDNALSALAAELRAEQAPTDSIDVDRTLAELASLRDEQARLRSDLKALPPPVVVEAPTDERPNADLSKRGNHGLAEGAGRGTRNPSLANPDRLSRTRESERAAGCRPLRDDRRQRNPRGRGFEPRIHPAWSPGTAARSYS